MTLYADEIESAAEDLGDAGAPVTFTDPAIKYDDTDSSVSTAPVTASSFGLRVKGDPKKLSDPNLRLIEPITLLVAAGPLGSYVPEPDHRMNFASTDYTVKLVDPLAPDGAPISYRVTGSK